MRKIYLKFGGGQKFVFGGQKKLYHACSGSRGTNEISFTQIIPNIVVERAQLVVLFCGTY